MIKRSFIFGALGLLLSACGGDNVIFQATKEIEGKSWNKDNPVSFSFNIEDTTTIHDFYFNLRTTSSYEWANMFLFVEITAPDEKFNIDTVEFVLADKQGAWYGKHSGSIVENDLLFITKKRFPAVGDYELKFTQAMRQDELPEILDVGLRIEEVEMPKH